MLEVVSEVAQDPRSGTEGQHPEAVPGYLIVVKPIVCLHLLSILVHIDVVIWMSVLCEKIKRIYVNFKVLGCHG